MKTGHASDTIVALATAPGVSAIAVIRLSGEGSIEITQKVFQGKNLTEQPSHSIHFGKIIHHGHLIDEVLVSIFRKPTSFTKENSVEISCHGSPFIVNKLIGALLDSGARLAQPGEFTKRAFLNNRFDLTQAEAIADLIQAESDSAHQAALHQMRGGFKKELTNLREELIHFAALIELELDFGEEDVEFVKRDELKKKVQQIKDTVDPLAESFQKGNVIKNGIRTVIAGRPNAGKSTLLNALLNEEKAIVSPIPGTTRDVIEDTIHIDGMTVRFIDTAGLREAQDPIEAIGIDRTWQEMKSASLILYLVDLTTSTTQEILAEESRLQEMGIPYLIVGNKIDQVNGRFSGELPNHWVMISAAKKSNLNVLKDRITGIFQAGNAGQDGTIVTNLRHYQNLTETSQALGRVLSGLDSRITSDFIALDIRQSLHHLGLITGEISTDDLLDSIFSRFCIGK
jgi:tRNA modification GTPase